MLTLTVAVHPPKPTQITGLARNSTALVRSLQQDDGGAEATACPETELLTHCVYFLVSAAKTGPLAGIFKLGIADHLPTRHQQHARTWGAFDLSCSAVVWAGSRRDVERLEGDLKHVFGECAEERQARADGRVMTSDEFRAAGSWRRYPGRRDNGYREFFDVDCMELMFARVKNSLASRGKRAAGAYLQRGITPANCALRLRDGRRPPLSREERSARRDQQRADYLRSQQRLRAQYYVVMGQVLNLALAFEPFLTWVDLRSWYLLRENGGYGICQSGLVNLYFRRFEDTPSAADADPASWTAAQEQIKERVALILASLSAAGMKKWGDVGCSREICTLHRRHHDDLGRLPHSFCLDKLIVRLECCWSSPYHPLFEPFEALARRVEGRHRWEETELC